MGGLTEGVLARRRVLAAPDRAAERLLAQDTRPERVHRSLPSFPGMLSEPPGADPHAGWCGRGQGEPGLYPIRRAGRGNGPAATPAPRPGSTRPLVEADDARLVLVERQTPGRQPLGELGLDLERVLPGMTVHDE